MKTTIQTTLSQMFPGVALNWKSEETANVMPLICDRSGEQHTAARSKPAHLANPFAAVNRAFAQAMDGVALGFTRNFGM